MKLRTLTAEQILAVPKDKPESVFSADNFAHEYAVARGIWHPDRNANPLAKDVFSHLTELNASAVKKTAENAWEGPSIVKWRGHTSKYELAYLRATPYELGVVYDTNTKVLFLNHLTHKNLSANYLEVAHNLKYGSDKMRDEFARLMPSIQLTVEVENTAIMLRKTPDVLPLRAVLNHLGGSLPATHVAWIISRLQNIAAFLQFNELSHQALSLDTLYISPEFHTVLPLGGWGYSKHFGKRVSDVPAALLPFYPKVLLEDKTAHPKTDQALIKALGLQLLGDPTGTGSGLRGRADIPLPMLEFLQGVPAGDAFLAFSKWSKVLEASFGARKFVELKVSASDIY